MVVVKFCAGKYLRGQAEQTWEQEKHYWKNFKSAIQLSARYGGWSLSLTGSGEPAVDPEAITKALEQYKECADQGAYMPKCESLYQRDSFRG